MLQRLTFVLRIAGLRGSAFAGRWMAQPRRRDESTAHMTPHHAARRNTTQHGVLHAHPHAHPRARRLEREGRRAPKGNSDSTLAERDGEKTQLHGCAAWRWRWVSGCAANMINAHPPCPAEVVRCHGNRECHAPPLFSPTHTRTPTRAI